jgi:hypothetical protein
LRSTSFRVINPSQDHQARIVAVEHQTFSLLEIVVEVGVAVEAAVRVVVVVVVADEGQVKVQVQVPAIVVRTTTVATHEITRGKTRAKRDKRITTGNEGTTKR